jgi:hypothetical protein
MKLPPNKSQRIDFSCQFKRLLRILTRLGVWACTLTNIECGFRLLKRAIEIGPPSTPLAQAPIRHPVSARGCARPSAKAA